MRIEYKCRYCKSSKVLTENGRRWGTRQVVCQDCCARGPLMSSELPSNDIIETLALNANAILAPDEVVVKRKDAEACIKALELYRNAEMNSGKPYPRTPNWMFPAAGIRAAISREVKP